MSKKFEIPAIHDKDLRKILETFGLTEKLDNNQLECSRCGNILTWDTIAAFRVSGNTLDIYCNDPECLEIASNS